MNAIAKREPPKLLSVEKARDFLARSKSFDEVKDIRDKAQAVRGYQRSIGAAVEAQQDAAEIVVLATRRMGELLRDMPKSEGGRPAAKTSCKTQPVCTLAGLGIEKTEAHRAQRLAEVPEEKFNAYVADRRAKGKPITKSGALALAKDPKPPEPAFHLLLALGDFKDAIRRLANRWPESERGALPQALRDLAAEFEE